MNDPEIPRFFGEWLKYRRKVLDLTQEELAQRSGYSVFALRKIESGERRPSKQLAGLLATALQIPEEDQPTFIRVARGELSLERLCSSAPITKSVSHTPQVADCHLPWSPTPLLGREAELLAIKKIFFGSQCRLLTLTGVGGIGKTRLGVEFASRWRDSFPGGVYFVPLASINSAELIVTAIAETLGFSFSGPVEPKEQLFNFLAHGVKQAALLLFDNFEHLLFQTSAVDLMAEILQRFPSIKILCTSRERLNLQGEWIYELHGLPFPPHGSVDGLEDYSAAVLFVECARRVNAEFELTEADKPALIQICQLVEGIPLAIELAAAWVGVLSCGEIAQEIASGIDFLTTSMRDIPKRHRSLRATFDYSWWLLADAERDVLSCLAVFRGGFDRLAAERVAGASLPLLSSLVSKSLIQRTQDGRYDLHKVIRQYALSRLHEDQVRWLEARVRHCEYYLNLAFNYEKQLKSASQQVAMRAMTLEIDNMRSAWEWGIRLGKFESIGKAARAFGWYFEVAGLIYDGIDQLELLVQAVNDQPRDDQLNKALGATLVQQGLLYFRSGQFARAQELYQNAIDILRLIGEHALLADGLIFSGTLAHLNGYYFKAKDLIQEGLMYARAANDLWFTAYGIYNLGHTDSFMGEYEKGYEQMQEGLALWRMIGDPHSISLGLNFLVETQIKLGYYEEAIKSMGESIALCERTKNRWGMGTAFRYLGLVTLATGRFSEAQDHLQKSLEIFGEYFTGWDIARSLTYLGDAAFMLGDWQEAKKIYLDVLCSAAEALSTPVALDAIVRLARVHLFEGEVEKAFELAHYVLIQPASTQETKDASRQLISEAEKHLDDDYKIVVRARTRDQTLESIVEICSGKSSPGK